MPAAGTCSQFENRHGMCVGMPSAQVIAFNFDAFRNSTPSFLLPSRVRIKYNYSPGYSPKNRILAQPNVLSTLGGTSGRLDTT